MANLVPSLSPDVFNQGAVRVNSDAFTNYVINTQARNRARDDAFTKYLAEQGNNINEKGVRSVDLPVILDAKNAWQQHSIQNKRALMNPSLDGGRAYAENQKLYNNLKNLIPQSQAAAANNKEFESIQKDPKKSALLTDAAVPEYHKSTLPINHPDYQPMDFTDIYNPKPWGMADQLRLSNEVSKLGTETAGTPEPIGGGKQKIKYSRSFSPQELTNVATEAHNLYGHNAGFKQMIESIDPKSPEFKTYNDTFKEHYGRDISNPEDAAAAYILGSHNKMQREEVGTIPQHHRTDEERLDYQKKLLNLKQQYKTPKAGKGGTADASMPIEDDVNKMIEDSKANPRVISGIGMEPDRFNGYNLSPKIKEAFAERTLDVKGKQTVVPLGELGFSKDGTKAKLVYYIGTNDAKGNPKVIKTLTKEIPIEQFKKEYGGRVYTKSQVLKEAKMKKSDDPQGLYK